MHVLGEGIRPDIARRTADCAVLSSFAWGRKNAFLNDQTTCIPLTSLREDRGTRSCAHMSDDKLLDNEVHSCISLNLQVFHTYDAHIYKLLLFCSANQTGFFFNLDIFWFYNLTGTILQMFSIKHCNLIILMTIRGESNFLTSFEKKIQGSHPLQNNITISKLIKNIFSKLLNDCMSI